MSAFSPVLSVFLLVLTGWLLCRLRVLKDGGIQALTSLVLYVAIPCISVAKMQQEASPELVRDLAIMFFLGLALMAASGAVGYLCFRRAPEAQRAVLIHLCMLSNCGFMGYPIVIAVLGEAYLIHAVAFNAAFNVMAWTVGVLLLNKGRGVSWGKALLTPALIGALLGLVFFLTGLRLPGFLQETVETLGGLTTPLSMLVIGARMCGQSPKSLWNVRMIAVSALRLAIFPLLTFGIAMLLGLSPAVRNALALLVGMPCAAVTAMHAEHYGGDRVLASGCVTLTTALSLASIPLLALLF